MRQAHWRAMEPGDIEAVAGISDAVHGSFTEPASVYADRLTRYPAGCFVLEIGGAIAGYLITHPWTSSSSPALRQPLGAIPDDADTYYLHDIALLPVARGMGAGGSALALVTTQARAAGFADVSLVAVNGADSYWVRQGFAYVTGDAGPYGEGTHRMRLALGS